MARDYGVSQGWVSRLMARHSREGGAAFEPASRRPRIPWPSQDAQFTAAISALSSAQRWRVVVGNWDVAQHAADVPADALTIQLATEQYERHSWPPPQMTTTTSSPSYRTSVVRKCVGAALDHSGGLVSGPVLFLSLRTMNAWTPLISHGRCSSERRIQAVPDGVERHPLSTVRPRLCSGCRVSPNHS